MDSTYDETTDELTPPLPRRYFRTYGIPLLLFLFTIITTMIAGTALAGKEIWEITNWWFGLPYSLLVMTFLSAHEFGHYFASKYHKVDASLPYFLPMPFVFLSPFGTFGAFIKTNVPIPNRKALFDIGVAGPLAGFVVCLIILIIGLTNLPPKEYLYSIHPEFMMQGGEVSPYGLYFGTTILYETFAKLFVSPNEFLPPMNKIYHYPFLCVGWFGMFVTALNMLPIGQLDGGHVIYAMFGKQQRIISRIFWWVLLVIGMGSIIGIGLGWIEQQLYVFAPTSSLLDLLAWIKTHFAWYFEGWNGWLFWVAITRFIMKLDHPSIRGRKPIGRGRMIVGFIAIAIFVLSFSFQGIYNIPEGYTKQTNGVMKTF
jgi:membrane-associated protease RseP (regulator of RpoE activity)